MLLDLYSRVPGCRRLASRPCLGLREQKEAGKGEAGGGEGGRVSKVGLSPKSPKSPKSPLSPKP